MSSEWEDCEELAADPLAGLHGVVGCAEGRRVQRRRRRRSDHLRWVYLGTRSSSRLVWQEPHGGLGFVVVLVKQEGVWWWVWEQAHCGQLVQGL